MSFASAYSLIWMLCTHSSRWYQLDMELERGRGVQPWYETWTLQSSTFSRAQPAGTYTGAQRSIVDADWLPAAAGRYRHCSIHSTWRGVALERGLGCLP